MNLALRRRQLSGDAPSIVLDTIPEAYVRMDAQLRFTFVNRAAVPLLGSTPERSDRKDALGGSPGVCRHGSGGGLTPRQRRNNSVSFENHFEPLEPLVWHHRHARCQRRSGGSVFGHHRKEEERRTIPPVFQGRFEGGVPDDPQGQFQRANPALARMMRYDSSEDLLATVQRLGKAGVGNGGRSRRICPDDGRAGSGARTGVPAQVQRRGGNPGFDYRSKGCGAGWQHGLLRGICRGHHGTPGVSR